MLQHMSNPHFFHSNYKKGITKVKIATSFPIIRLATGNAKIPPKIPVPITSAIQVNQIFFVYLYAIPQRKAPAILPGKASNVPVPKIFLIKDVEKAAPTP